MAPLKLFVISQDENTNYDTFDSAVVCAPSEDQARLIVPGLGPYRKMSGDIWAWRVWCSSPDKVKVRYIGEAAPEMQAGVVLSSFNSG